MLMSAENYRGERSFRWLRWPVVIVCLTFALARLYWPQAKVDSITVWLILMAAIAFLIPEWIPLIDTVEFGRLKVVLRKQVQNLGGELEQAVNSVGRQGRIVAEKDRLSDPLTTLREATRGDPKTTLLALFTALENEVRKRLEEANLPAGRRYAPLVEQVRAGVEAGIFPKEILKPLQDFWNLRNSVVHQMAFDVDDATLFSIASLGIDLLKMIRTKPGPA